MNSKPTTNTVTQPKPSSGMSELVLQVVYFSSLTLLTTVLSVQPSIEQAELETSRQAAHKHHRSMRLRGGGAARVYSYSLIAKAVWLSK